MALVVPPVWAWGVSVVSVACGVCRVCVCWCAVLLAVVLPLPCDPGVCVCECCVSLCVGVGAVWGLCALGLQRVSGCVCAVMVQVCGYRGMPYLFWFFLSADMVTIKGLKQSPVNV